MPIRKKWSSYNVDALRRIPNTLGIYELADNSGTILYIGEGNIRERLADHLTGEDKKVGAGQFRYEETKSKTRAQQRERSELRKYEKKHGRLPKYNTYDEIA